LSDNAVTKIKQLTAEKPEADCASRSWTADARAGLRYRMKIDPAKALMHLKT
jgi:hypothetical protein